MSERKTEYIPESFGEAFKDSYLGDPETVTQLVSAFLASFEHMLSDKESGNLSPAMFVEKAHAMVSHYADIFSGRAPGYRAIAGYHSRSLGNKLKVDLGEFWQKNRGTWNDDPVAVLFEYLAVMAAEKMKRADGDEDLLEIMLKPTVQYVVHVLIGTEARLV